MAEVLEATEASSSRPSGYNYKPETKPIDLQGKPRWQRERELRQEARDRRRSELAAAQQAAADQ